MQSRSRVRDKSRRVDIPSTITTIERQFAMIEAGLSHHFIARRVDKMSTLRRSKPSHQLAEHPVQQAVRRRRAVGQLPQ